MPPPQAAATMAPDSYPKEDDAMTLLPKTPIDLSLAPVAVALDINVSRLRDCTPAQIDYQLSLELDRPERSDTAQERAERILAVAVRNVDLHGWVPTITEDHCRLRLSGGSVTLDLGLGAEIMHYINERTDRDRESD